MSTTSRSLYYLLLSLCLLVSIITVYGQQDPYKALNVPKHATQKEIRKAFKSLALKYHPDRNLPSSDPERMKKITAAYEILGDPDRRKKHDDEQHQNNVFRAHGYNIRRNNGGSSDGIGVSLTNYNYYNLLYNINDLPWLIFATEDFCQACKQAKSVFEDACIKLSGIARCAKVDVNKDSALISEFSLRRVPHFIIFYNHNGKVYKKNIGWRGRQQIKMHTLIDAVAEIFPKKCNVLKTQKELAQFLDDVKFTDDYYNKVKAIIFSDAKKRQTPHILLEYLATRFETNIDFAYVHMDTSRAHKLQLVYNMAAQIGLDIDELEPPSMYILRSPLIHDTLITITDDNILQSLEDIGIYHIALSSDVDSMTQFVEQYSLPLIPKIDGDNYLEQCYFSNSLENVDEDKICYLFSVNNEIDINLKKLFLFGQYVLAQLPETVQFGWINCEQQQEFCNSLKIVPSSGGDSGRFKVKLVAVKAYQDYYQLYENGKDILLKENDKLKIKEWISILEKDDVVFGDERSSGNVCNESDKNCKVDKKLDDGDRWKRGVLYPIKTPKWVDSIDNVLGGMGSVFGFIGDGVGAGFSAVSTVLSSIFQIIFVVIIFLFLLPMLRMAR